MAAGTSFYRVYSFKYGYDSFNPGVGNTRFAPFADSAGVVVPTMYGGVDPTVVLLESVFHEVGARGDRVIYERSLRERGLAYATSHRSLQLVDLRDSELGRLGLGRHQLVAADSAHYACTREWAQWLHRLSIGGKNPDGLIWDSRSAELVPSSQQREVFVLFGDRAPSAPGSYPLDGPGVRNLFEGEGRVRVDELAEELDARVELLDP
ncbi:MAG: RES family NAD+ phosphorylase [Acidimicrobiales bacterium]